MGLSLKFKKLASSGGSIGGLAEDTAFQGQNLIGTKDKRIGVLVLTLPRLEFGQRIDHVPGRGAFRFHRRTDRGLVDSDRRDIEGQAGGFEHFRPRFGAGGEDKSGHNITLFWAFLLIVREEVGEKPGYHEARRPRDLRFTTCARFRRGFPPGMESSPPAFGNPWTGCCTDFAHRLLSGRVSVNRLLNISKSI
jgi:hypothetical protein